MAVAHVFFVGVARFEGHAGAAITPIGFFFPLRPAHRATMHRPQRSAYHPFFVSIATIDIPERGKRDLE